MPVNRVGVESCPGYGSGLGSAYRGERGRTCEQVDDLRVCNGAVNVGMSDGV